jgi:hypothetical protein
MITLSELISNRKKTKRKMKKMKKIKILELKSGTRDSLSLILIEKKMILRQIRIISFG